jgi:hypothetical protein
MSIIELIWTESSLLFQERSIEALCFIFATEHLKENRTVKCENRQRR